VSFATTTNYNTACLVLQARSQDHAFVNCRQLGSLLTLPDGKLTLNGPAHVTAAIRFDRAANHAPPRAAGGRVFSSKWGGQLIAALACREGRKGCRRLACHYCDSPRSCLEIFHKKFSELRINRVCRCATRIQFEWSRHAGAALLER
jgi:hypothetical protein